MRNKFEAFCYQCGVLVKKGDGHFQRAGQGWRVHHAACAVKYRDIRNDKKNLILRKKEQNRPLEEF